MDFDVDRLPAVKCPNCESQNLSWSNTVENTSTVQDGRLTMHDVKPIVVQGCDECSETTWIGSFEEFVDWLGNQHGIYAIALASDA